MRPLLILHAADLWILHLLEIKLDQLQAQRSDRAETHETLDPCQHVHHSAFQRGSQPPFAPSPIGKAGLSVAGVALSASSTNGPALVEGFFNGICPMHKFCREDHFSRRLIDQGDPSRLTPWINLQAERMNLWGERHAFQNDRKRVAAKHRRFALREQHSCSPWMHRGKWLLVCI